MFKSIFTKYVAAFMAIIIASFAVLALFVGAMIYSNSIDEYQYIAEESAFTVKDYLENEYRRSIASNLNLFVYQNYASLKRTLTLFTSYEGNLTLMLTDLNGNVLLTDNLADESYAQAVVPPDYIETTLNNGVYQFSSDMGGIFESQQLIYAIPMKDRLYNVCGVIFAFTDPSSLTELSALLIKTIFTAMVCVLLAALITVYVISKKITSPIKKLAKAAKEYSKGNFKVRVNVKGNDEIAQLADSFNNMAEALENYEKTRSSFIANISHDLRTPMTSISGFIDGIIDGAIPQEKHTYYFNIIAKEVKRLSRLVSSLLDISRFEAGEKKLVYSTFDICEMARQIVISFEKKIEEKKLNVLFDWDDFNINATADKDSIHQILYNICDNAIKFSKEGGDYSISIKQKAKKIFVSVRNEGQGISPEDIPFVFDRFYKSDKSRGLDKTGVGLGLYISKTIIEAHGQEIWVESAYGEYCEFVFTLEKA